MSDVVVTVPKNFTHECAPGLRGLAAWIAEGDAAGDPDKGHEWAFSVGSRPKDLEPGDRVYVFCEDRLRGYAPLIRVEQDGGQWLLIRGGNAVAVSLPKWFRQYGFQGFRYRWWDRKLEMPFPEWRTPW